MSKTKEKITVAEDEYLYLQTQEKEQGKEKFALKFFLFCFSGLAFSCFDGFAEISPFALAFLSAVPFNYCVASFVGSTVGCFITAENYALIKYVGALVIMALFRLFTARRLKEKEVTLLNSVVSFCIMISMGLVRMWLDEVYLESFLLLVCESLLVLACSYFFITAFRVFPIQGSLSALSQKSILSLTVSLCLTLMCLSSLDIQGISLGRIFSCVIMMFVCIYKGVSAGAVCGALIGAFMCFLPDGAYLFPAFVLSALVGGFLSETGQTILSVAFSGVYITVALVCGDISQSLISIIEPIIACAVFLIIPANKISELEEYMDKIIFTPKNMADVALSNTLKTASENIGSVAHIISDVSDKLDKIINPEVDRLFSSLQQKVCDGCKKKAECWNRDFDSTAGDILSVMGVEGGKEGRIRLSVICKRYDLLCNAITSLYPSYSTAMASKIKVSEMRKLLTDQFEGISDFLGELSVNICQSRTRDKGKSAYLKTALRDSSIPVESLDCYFFKGRVSVELTLPENKSENAVKKLKPIVEFLTKRRFDETEVENKNSLLYVKLKEKASYRIKSGYSQRPLKAGNLCGDTVAVFSSGPDFFNAVISDGMGTGSRAAIDSTMTASIVEKLICSDFSYECALRMVNSALIMKSTDESIATLDAVQINPYTCKASFYKAGGAISFIRQGESVTVLEKASLPMGIIRNVPLAYEERELKVGDIVLLVSDGVTNQDCGWINDELLAWSKSDMQSLASHIASLARLRTEKNTKDDITVVALKVAKAE